jgi:glucan phosphorylase
VETRWQYRQQGVRRVYYLSMEFLLGRPLCHNLARMGRFSSDRMVREYAREIWHIEP